MKRLIALFSILPVLLAAQPTPVGGGVGKIVAGTNITVSPASGQGPSVTVTATGGGTWGSITGTLSDQTDLNSAIQGAEITVASASTTDLGAVASNKVSITGTTTITSFGSTAAAGVERKGRFTGALTLTHNATSLILPGAQNIATSAGDRFTAYSLGSGNWVVTHYTKADGTPLLVGNLTYPANTGATTFLNMPVTSSAPAGTEESYVFALGGSPVLKIYGESDGANGTQNRRVEVNGAQLNRALSVYAAGTAYTITASDALADFGTTDPTLVLDKAGTWLLMGRAYVRYNGATYAANQTATVHLRRTNNTAADVANATTTAQMRIITTITDSVGIMSMPPVIYTTTNATDSISVYGSVSATPSAGSVEISEASIVAIRLY